MEKQLRYSRQRDLIYKYLLMSDEHPRAIDIYDNLKNDITNLSLATVYRNLKVLEELGKVKRVMVNSNTERYDAHCEEHAHFICETCGKVIDLRDINVLDLKEHLKGKSHGNKINFIGLTFNGLCANCSK